MQVSCAPPPPPPPPPPVAAVACIGLDCPSLQEEFLGSGGSVLEKKRLKDVEEHRKCEVILARPFDVSLSAELSNITASSWDRATTVHSSSGGSGGVFFVSGLDGSCASKQAVLKGSGEPAREVFATRVLRRLNVATPHVRVINFSTLEWANVKATIARLCEGEARFRAEKSLNRPQLLLFEFVAGRSVLEISPDDDVWRNEQVMEEMGLVMAGDVVLNNLDRLPLPLWDNEGNLGNLLVQTDNRVVAIDTALFAIKSFFGDKESNVNPQFSRHFVRLDKLLLDLQGLRVARAVLTPRVLDEEKAAVAGMGGAEDWQNVWQKDVACIDTAFMSQIIARISL